MAFTSGDTLLISSQTALEIAENLMNLVGTVVRNLPEHELRIIQLALEDVARVVDDSLYNLTISSSFDMLTLNDASTTCNADISTVSATSNPRISTQRAKPKTSVPPPASVTRDDALTAVGDDELIVAGYSATRNNAFIPAPASSPTGFTPVPVPDPDTSAERKYEMIISSRPHVGRPNYTFHPRLVAPGIPGPYTRPPISPSNPDPAAYYVVTKGLYIGIFASWSECSPWVIKVAGSVFCKVRQWNEAMMLYNARLESDSCEVLH